MIALHTGRTSSKALFIDMGSNLGQGFRFFSRHYSPNIFDYWLVEPNPFCIDDLRANVLKLYKHHRWNGKWKIINAAVSDKDGTLNLYGLVEDIRGKTSDGASVIKDHNSAFYESNENMALNVQAIQASNLIDNAFNIYSTIVVKMDIEASEYDALDDMIGAGSINKISHIYVEWHSQYFSADKIGDILVRESRIKALLGGKLTDWH